MSDRLLISYSQEEFMAVDERLKHTVFRLGNMASTVVAATAAKGRKMMAADEAALFDHFSHKWTVYRKEGKHTNKTWYDSKKGYMIGSKSRYKGHYRGSGRPMIMFNWERQHVMRIRGGVAAAKKRASVTSTMANLYENGAIGRSGNLSPWFRAKGWKGGTMVDNNRPGMHYFYSRGKANFETVRPFAIKEAIAKWNNEVKGMGYK